MSENLKDKEGNETKPSTETKPKVKTFYDLLKEGKIKVGDKIGFTPENSKKEKVIIADESFLNLKTKSNEYYEKFKYNLK